MDREEKLRAAKERLKQFQKKRQKDSGGTNGDDSSSEPRSSPFTAAHFHDDSSQHNDSRRERSVGELPVFTMGGNSSYAASNDGAPAFFDDIAISSASSMSNVDTSPLHVAALATPFNEYHFMSTSNNVGQFFEQSVTTTPPANESDNNEAVVLKSQLEDLSRAKDELEKQLLVQAASIKQYDVYCQSLASELTSCQALLEKERKDLRAALETESGSLRAQLQSHADSIKILVAEKADFENSLRKLNAELASKNAELVRLQQSNSSEAEAARREQERAEIKAEVESRIGAELEQVRQELRQSKQATEDLQQEVAELGSKVNAKDKANEALKADLKLKTSKLEMAELNLAQLRAAKDSDESRREEAERLAEKEAELARVTSENLEHIQRVSEFTAYIHQASIDREQIIHQYTSYSQQLATQIESLSHQLNERAQENHELSSREKDLVSHVQQLEAQLQKLIQGESESHHQRGDAGLRAEELALLRQQVTHLDAQVTQLQEERNRLQENVNEQSSKISELTQTLAAKEETLTELETQLEMAQSNGTADVSQIDLMAACQSDKVAASRAMIQNKQLKDQLDELQTAIVQVTNSKADLVTDYDALKSAKERQDKEENTLRMEIRGLHAALAERDRNLNHMREQMKYYIAFAENSIEGHLESGPRKPVGDQEQIRDLISKLQSAKEEIRCLNSHNSELRSQLEVLSSRTRDSSGTPDMRGDDSAETTPPPLGGRQTPSMSESPRPPPSPSPSASSSFTSSSSPNNVTPPASLPTSHSHGLPDEFIKNTNHGYDDNSRSNNNNIVGEVEKKNEASPLHRPPDPIPALSRDVALLKLEKKFKQAMSRIEELTSEKEHLEHVIIQLQEETETVGEYITIYQYQRQQQRRRLEENERQLQIVSRDREDLKSKLSQLQSLVTSFVQDGGSHAKTNSGQKTLNGPSNHNGQYEIAEDALEREISSVVKTHKLSSSTDETGQLISDVDLTEPLAPVVVEASRTSPRPVTEPQSSPTKADKILALISEIGANQMLTNMEDFQPWFWEHSPGKLINI